MSAASEAAQAAATLRLVLGKILAGEIDAPPGMVRRLQGSLAALEAVSRGQRPTRPKR